MQKPTTAAHESDPYVLAYPELRAFWDAAAQGLFLLRHCSHCRRAHWYPRMRCPLCGSAETAWRPACGRASLFAFSHTVHDGAQGTLAYATLEEGPRMLTRVVDADVGRLHLGQALVFARMAPLVEGRSVPIFAPAVST